MSSGACVRIGGASGFWGDTASGPRQLALGGRLDFITFDYLAESTMAVLAKARARNPARGYATDFIDLAMRPLLPRLAADGVRILANAGGVNLPAARDALAALASELGLDLRIATVEGDDLLGRIDRIGPLLRPMGPQALPARIASANAYLGAFPIARALDAGAGIVLTGRCVDSALTLGALIHAFGWRADDYDRLAQGSLCGHLLECGAQATGGNFTDWRDTAPGWSRTGFPIAIAEADGSFDIVKPGDTGGAVTRLTVAEQLVYEIGDPSAYLLPDVTCDFRGVRLDETAPGRVRVSGARGRPPTSSLKATLTYFDGHACRAATAIVGFDARAKAEAMGAAILERAAEELRLAGLPPLGETRIDVLGGGPAGESGSAVLRVAVRHESEEGALVFAREFVGAGLSMSPGIAPLSPGRPGVSPLVRVASFLIDKNEIVAHVDTGQGDGIEVAFAGPYADASASGFRTEPVAPPPAGAGAAPLIALAVARSGDKGNDANIGVIARRPGDLERIRAAVTPERVLTLFADTGVRAVEIADLPGIAAVNVVLRDALGGGGPGSLHLDPLAKTFAQRLLALPVGGSPPS